jgi:LCP family protein required for cell wall assembly
MAVGITLASILVISLVAVAVYALVINSKLNTDLQGNRANFDTRLYEGVLVEPEKPEDPFWVLLLGTDDREENEVPRTDTIILVRVNPQDKTAAMVSIPRDLYVNIPDHGNDKINAAYAYAEANEPGSGPAQTIRTVSAFAGVDIAYFAQINFTGLEQLVDGLGGVEVNVPVDIVNDHDSGGLDIYTGVQVLDGAHALAFCRARNPFEALGDFQRQANQRTFLQALAKQVLASDPVTIATTLTNMANMTFTNMDLAKIVKVAQDMQGMQENGIHTYHVESEVTMINELSYVVANNYAWQKLMSALNAGEYPGPQDDSYAGIVPESYIANTAQAAEDQLAGQASTVNPASYVVDVRNGYGIAGSAAGVSEMLVQAGYVKGEVGNANSYIYETTYIIYKSESDRIAAEDIRKRLGYGSVLASLERYTFDGNVLVVVGSEFSQS